MKVRLNSAGCMTAAECASDCPVVTYYGCPDPTGAYNPHCVPAYPGTYLDTYSNFADCHRNCPPYGTRWKCTSKNTSMARCVKDVAGPYASYFDCYSDGCQPVAANFRCDRSNPFDPQCLPDPNGAYTHEERCWDFCTLESDLWECADPDNPNANLRCRLNDTGIFKTRGNCLTVCQPAGTKFKCVNPIGVFGCEPADDGPYSSIESCSVACQPTTKFKCVNPNAQFPDVPCQPDSNGPYSTIGSCNTACQPSSSKYICNDPYNEENPCATAPPGTPGAIYSSDERCRLACKPVGTKYKCVNPDAGPGEEPCIDDPSGGFTSLDACHRLCQSNVGGEKCVVDRCIFTQDSSQICYEHMCENPCLTGEVMSCGCDMTGWQMCNENGKWGACSVGNCTGETHLICDADTRTCQTTPNSTGNDQDVDGCVTEGDACTLEYGCSMIHPGKCELHGNPLEKCDGPFDLDTCNHLSCRAGRCVETPGYGPGRLNDTCKVGAEPCFYDPITGESGCKGPETCCVKEDCPGAQRRCDVNLVVDCPSVCSASRSCEIDEANCREIEDCADQVSSGNYCFTDKDCPSPQVCRCPPSNPSCQAADRVCINNCDSGIEVKCKTADSGRPCWTSFDCAPPQICNNFKKQCYSPFGSGEGWFAVTTTCGFCENGACAMKTEERPIIICPLSHQEIDMGCNNGIKCIKTVDQPGKCMRDTVTDEPISGQCILYQMHTECGPCGSGGPGGDDPSESHCNAEGQCEPFGGGAECETDDYCTGLPLGCNNETGQCAPGADGESCEEDSDCEGGAGELQCTEDAKCERNGGGMECEENSDCEDPSLHLACNEQTGQCALDNVIEDECLDDSDCQPPDDFKCTPDGQCAPFGGGAECNPELSNIDCSGLLGEGAECNPDCASQPLKCDLDTLLCTPGASGQDCDTAGAPCTPMFCTDDSQCAEDGTGVPCDPENPYACIIYELPRCGSEMNPYKCGNYPDAYGRYCARDIDCGQPQPTKCDWDHKCTVWGTLNECNDNYDCSSAYHCAGSTCSMDPGAHGIVCNGNDDCVQRCTILTYPADCNIYGNILVPKYRCAKDADGEPVCIRDDIFGSNYAENCAPWLCGTEGVVPLPTKYRCVYNPAAVGAGSGVKYICIEDDVNGNWSSKYECNINYCSHLTFFPGDRYRCAGGDCIQDNENGTFLSDDCDGRCENPGQCMQISKCVEAGNLGQDPYGATCSTDSDCKYKCHGYSCTQGPYGGALCGIDSPSNYDCMAKCDITSVYPKCSTSGTGSSCTENNQCQSGGYRCNNATQKCERNGNGEECGYYDWGKKKWIPDDSRCVAGCEDYQCVAGGLGAPCDLTDPSSCLPYACTSDKKCEAGGSGMLCDPSDDNACHYKCYEQVEYCNPFDPHGGFRVCLWGGGVYARTSCGGLLGPQTGDYIISTSWSEGECTDYYDCSYSCDPVNHICRKCDPSDPACKKTSNEQQCRGPSPSDPDCYGRCGTIYGVNYGKCVVGGDGAYCETAEDCCDPYSTIGTKTCDPCGFSYCDPFTGAWGQCMCTNPDPDDPDYGATVACGDDAYMEYQPGTTNCLCYPENSGPGLSMGCQEPKPYVSVLSSPSEIQQCTGVAGEAMKTFSWEFASSDDYFYNSGYTLEFSTSKDDFDSNVVYSKKVFGLSLPCTLSGGVCTAQNSQTVSIRPGGGETRCVEVGGSQCYLGYAKDYYWRVKVEQTNERNGAKTESEWYYYTDEACSDPTLTITSPSYGANCDRGHECVCSWIYDNMPASERVSVSVKSMSTDTSTTWGSDIPVSDRSYSWSVPTGQALGPYKFKVRTSRGIETEGEIFNVVCLPEFPESECGPWSGCQPGAIEESRTCENIRYVSSGECGPQTETQTHACTPSIAITSPNGGEQWALATNETLTWTYSGMEGGGDKTYLQLYKCDSNCGTSQAHYTIAGDSGIVSGISLGSGGHGSYTWNAGRVASGAYVWPGNNYKIKILHQNSGNTTIASDMSNADFTIFGDSITITSPAGGEYWRRGNQHNITWSSENLEAGATVNILAYDQNGTDYSVGSALASSGSFTWTVGTNLPLDRNPYHINISVMSHGHSIHAGSGFFSIFSQDEEKTISVTSPSGGESWRLGSTQTISWNSTGLENVGLHFVSAQLGLSVITTVPANQHFYFWNVGQVADGWPPIPAEGGSYKIFINGAQANWQINAESPTITILPAVSLQTPETFIASIQDAVSGVKDYAINEIKKMFGAIVKTLSWLNPFAPKEIQQYNKNN